LTRLSDLKPTEALPPNEKEGHTEIIKYRAPSVNISNLILPAKNWF
jgi:hypothetical protein